MAIEIKSFNQILGGMVRKVVAETPLNDVNPGSVLLSLLEACASNDFENNAAIINLLELLNVDAIKNNDLDARAGDYGLTRRTAVKASGLVSILNTNITKRSTGLYIIKPAPISGQSKLYVNNTDGWADVGSLYIGRGTDSFEGPITYTDIQRYPTYSEITLATSLQKDHLISDTVIDSQGESDRLIASGTVVKIPANNQNPEILYKTLREAVIPAGEDKVDNVEVMAVVAGSQGNAPINTINQFESAPFSGAAVINTSSFSSGKDIETDTELRNRVKSYTITLARGTAPSIVSAVLGVSDPDDSKQVASAVMQEPIKIGAPSILYIDDGSGFQPSFAGQSVDKLLSNANGNEEFLQLANFPVTRPQVINAAEGPFLLKDSMFIRVAVDGTEQTIVFSDSDFRNISAATLAEVISAINTQANENKYLFRARFADNSNRILVYPTQHDAETLQVVPLRITDDVTLNANSVLKFPTNEVSYISLYKNSERLREKDKAASVESVPYASWGITTQGNISLAVDGTPQQDRTFSISDFPNVSSFSSLTLEDWVSAFNSKFAGINAEVTPAQTMKIYSNKVGKTSTLSIDGGSYRDKIFPGVELSSTGQSSQFQLNRQTGNLRILEDIEAGDNISAGSEDTKGFVISSSTTSGIYNVSNDSSGRPSAIVVVLDSDYCDVKSVPAAVGTTLWITAPDAATMRISSSASNTFSNLLPGDYIYVTSRSTGWLSDANTGLYKIKAKGSHTTTGETGDSFIEVSNDTTVVESKVVQDPNDIKAFTTHGYPQVWRGSYASNPAAESITNLVSSINDNILGIKASIFRSNSIKLTSTTENGGSIAIPVVSGNMVSIFSNTSSRQTGNPSHAASKTSDKIMLGGIKTTQPTNSNVWLNRYVYSSVNGSLTANSVPSEYPFNSTYSETLQASADLISNISPSDVIKFVRGNNEGQVRTVKSKITSNSLGTQQDVARTEFDHVAGDQIMAFNSLRFSADDSVVTILDDDAANKTIDIKIARSAKVNSGSNSTSFVPNSTEFSADDLDNEPGIDFSNVNVWGTSLNKTNFSDYAVLMRSRNWYASGGTTSTDGKLLIRANQYGQSGNKLRFNIEYPAAENQDPSIALKNTPSWSLASYTFGSGANRALSLSSGDTISVSGPYPDASTNFPNGATSTGSYYDYTFSAGNLSSVIENDILSISTFAGISSFNRGQFRVAAKNGNTVRVYNPDGSATSPGSPEITTFTTVADIQGTRTNVTMNVTSAASLDGKYLILYDNAGSVKMWFDVDNNGTPEPFSAAHNRTIRVFTLQSTDTSSQVAAKIAAYLSNDPAFVNVFSVSNQVIFDMAQNGPVSSPLNGLASPAFTYSTNMGLADISLSGKYIKIHDDEGSVAVWFDVGSDGVNEPFHGADRSIKVDTIEKGDSANIVAAAIAAAVNFDSKFIATSSGNSVTITTNFNANTPGADVGTTSFGVSIVSGTMSGAEVISNPLLVSVYPITGNTSQDIADKINESSILKAAVVGDPEATINKRTKDEDYINSGNSTALAYNHNPSNSELNSFISLYDGINWIKQFSNNNPNFILKEPLALNGVAPSVYSMHTAPNEDEQTGELFKLVPTTTKNIYHHLTQKALSQLPIVSDTNISNFGDNLQIKSKQLGSDGVLEIVGGRANSAQSTIIGESETVSDVNGSLLQIRIQAFPDTFSAGDIVKIQNPTGVKRLSRLSTLDSVSVIDQSLSSMQYVFNPKDIGFEPTTQLKIQDVSSVYGRPNGTVWRWKNDGSGTTLASVKPGDLVCAFGELSGWDQGNKARETGDGAISGYPIIAVNDTNNWFDVVNPFGKEMNSFTPIGAGYVQITPTPVIKWNIDHAAPVSVSTMKQISGNITVKCTSAHNLNTGDQVQLKDSSYISDGIYGTVTVINNKEFSFAYAPVVSVLVTEQPDIKASIIKDGVAITRYTLERLDSQGLTKITRYDGRSPRFLDCGVALDDYIVISGDTFKSNNSGRFRVIAVDNDSIIIENPISSDELNTLGSFNNKGLVPQWTSNSNVVTGAAGTFKYVSIGDWVKKSEDTDNMYVQVLSMNTTNPDTATYITLGSNYMGLSGQAVGVTYNQYLNYNKGVYLKNINDISFYEGDSVVSGDTLSVQNIVNSSWFSVQNTGSFPITEYGSSLGTIDGVVGIRPFIRVYNSAGVEEYNRLMSVNTDGLYIVESLSNKFYSYRKIEHTCIDSLTSDRRSLFLSPSNRSYKFSQANSSFISHAGKMGYNTDVIVGIDGYAYHTGLLRRVQRIVDGFEPDANNFPGRRAVGSSIETLPPLIKSIKITLDISTNEGVNLSDISNSIKSTIITYVQGLGVGEDVILSEIIASVMQIKGVEAATFTYPSPSNERIQILSDEKATIYADDIGIA